MSHTKITSLRRRLKGESGAEIIEFAVVYPLLLLVILGVVDYAFLFQRFEAVTNAAREGARVATLPGYQQVDIEDRIATYLAAGAVPTTAGNPTVTVFASTIPNGAGTWPATTVSVSYNHDYLFIDSVIGWFGGSLTPSTLVANSTMRNEVDVP